MIGPLLMVMGILLLWVAARGKSPNLLQALDFTPMNIKNSIATVLQKMIFEPLSTAITNGIKGLNPFYTVDPGTATAGNPPDPSGDTSPHTYTIGGKTYVTDGKGHSWLISIN